MTSVPKAGPPRVSVLIPAYNAAATLRATLLSVQSQTSDDWEVIVIDDGSTDDTARVVRDMADPRMRCVQQANGGIPVARNRSCTEARGEYFAFLDADDLAGPHRLATQSRFLDEHPDVDLCFSNFAAFDDTGPLSDDFAAEYYPVLQRDEFRWDRLFERHSRWHVSPMDGASEHTIDTWRGSVYRMLAHGNFVHPPTIMMRRTLWERVGGFETRIRSVTEWEWLVRAARVGDFAYLDEPLIQYRRHESQITGPRHLERIATDVVMASELICAADPSLFERDRDWFRRDLRDFHWTLANVLANHRGADALMSLRKSLSYGWPGAMRVCFVLAKAVVPRRVLLAAKRWVKQARAQSA